MRAFFAAIFVLLLAGPAFAAYHKIGDIDIDFVTKDVSVKDSYALVAENSDGFHIVDISSPTDPIILYSYQTEGPAWRVTHDGARAYLIDWWEGMLIFDISNPTDARFLGKSPPFNLGNALLIDDDLAYVGTNTSLRLFDITDPAAIAQLHTFHVDNGILGLDKEGNTIYAAASVDGLLIVDVTHVPFFIRNTIPTIDTAYDVEIAGDIAYVADGWAGFLAIDISDPGNPVILSQYELPGSARDVEIEGDIARVTDMECGLHVLDVSDPSQIIPVETFHTPMMAEQFVVEDNIAYICDYMEGVQIVDMADAHIPDLVGSYRDLELTHEVRLEGTTALVADEYDGLVRIDISDPTAPSCVDRLDFQGNERCLDAEKGTVVVGTDYFAGGAIEICASLRSGDLVHTATHHAFGAVASVALQEGICYAAVSDDEYNAIECVDVSDPYHPTLLSRTPLGSFLASLTVDGDHVYCAMQYDGLYVHDFSNPSLPTMVGSMDTPGVAWSIETHGHAAFLANGEGGMLIVDISDPRNPILTSTILPHGSSDFVAKPEIRGTRLHMVDHAWNEIHTYDIQVPLEPAWIDTDRWNFTTAGLCSADGLLLTANRWAGLSILDLGGTSGVRDPAATTPSRIQCSIAPNPFRESTTVSLTVPGMGGPTVADVFNVSGRRVRRLQGDQSPEVSRILQWSGDDDRGRQVAAGVYYLRIESRGQVLTRKVLYVR